MPKLLSILFFVLISFLQLSAQISVNNNGQPPAGSAMLDVTSITKGVLIPRLTATQKAAITSPAKGLIVYDSTIQKFSYWTGNKWENILTSSDCPSGFINCSGNCVQLTNDENNCGSCGLVCANGYTCVNGTCTLVCPPGFTNCAGNCIKLTNDVNNCGACGLNCPSGYTCVNGTCALVCPSGYTKCGNNCVQLNSDESSCGACGSTCPSGYTCVGGSCVVICPPGQTNCAGSCIQLKSDVNNCGTCGNTCPPGKTCINGSCQ